MRDVHADTSLVSRHVDLGVFVCSPFILNFLCFCWDSGTMCYSGCNCATSSFILCVWISAFSGYVFWGIVEHYFHLCSTVPDLF